MIRRSLIFSAALLMAVSARAADQFDPAGLELFEKKIRPVLVEHCYKCHSADAKKLRANLLLDTRDGIRAGGDSGPAVVPGEVEESLIVSALRHESFEMPPAGKLPEPVVRDFEKWIELGAPDPRDGDAAAADRESIDWEQARRYWAFQPPVQPDLPAVADTSWPASDIDRFILARLEAEGLEPVADADAVTLARRIYFDLVGLPPTPAQVDEFVAAQRRDRQAALSELVERLLASPRFGERWGRHWLDVARFAESAGGGRTRIFPEAWRYRDYVIEAFNRDKPFDRFVREQIAGDLLPHETLDERRDQLTATAFLMLGPTNFELQDKELLRMEVIDEQIDTIGRAFLGLTLGCARCHDHKFDPLPTTDYYALAGIFRSTKTLTPGNVSGLVSQSLPVDEERANALREHQALVDAVNRKLAAAKKEVASLGGESSAKTVKLDDLPGIVVDDTEARLVGSWKSSTSEAGFLGSRYIHDENQGKGQKSAAFTAKLPAAGAYEVRLSYTASSNRASNAPVTVKHAEGEQRVTVNQRKSPPIDGVFIKLGRFPFRAGDALVVVSNEGSDGYVIADAVQFLPVGPDGTLVANDAAAEDDPAAARRAAERKAKLAAAEKKVKQIEAELKALQKKAPPAPPEIMAIQEQAEAGDYHVCIRGNAHNLGPGVPRGFLTVLPGGGPADIADDQSGRLELARWLTRPDHPLTSRVIVNRVWHHLFGAGIVRTTDNFGAMGQRPSHPELLDALAVEFVEHGWSIKRLIRRIVLSRTYQLACAEDKACLAADPENRLLWRHNRRRLDAEAFRDALLLFSGRLDLEVGGPTISDSVRSELGYEFKTLRRSVYVPAFRNAPHPLLAVFDAANPNIVSGVRNTSTLPTQALYLMNSPFVMDQARHAARSLLDVPDLDRPGRVELAFRRALARRPTSAEREAALAYLDEAAGDAVDAERRLDAWSRLCQSLVSCIDFRYLE